MKTRNRLNHPNEPWIRERVLWWKHFLPVVFAHKPLCGHFAHDVLNIRGVLVCRSCVCLYAGLVSGLIAGMIWGQWLTDRTVLSLGYAAVILTASFPPLYRMYPRRLRDALRALAGTVAALVVVHGIHQDYRMAVPLGLMILVSRWIFNRYRQRQKQAVCERCPEYHERKVCSGFSPKAKRMRAYERDLRELLSGEK